MPNFKSSAILLSFIFCNQFCMAQTDKIKLELRCHDTNYVVDYEKSSSITKISPSFILGIRNICQCPIEINPKIVLGTKNDTFLHKYLTYDLYYINGKDTLDVLKNVVSTEGLYDLSPKKISILPFESYLIDFYYLTDNFFKKSGLYKIRFTLWQQYAPEYMTKSSVTDWAYFNVVVPERKRL